MLSQFLRAALASAGGGETVTVFGSYSIRSGSVTLPAGISAGDLIIVMGIAHNRTGGFPVASTPSGYTQQINVTEAVGSEYTRSVAYSKLAAGTESSSVVSVFGSANARQLSAFVIRYTSAVSAISLNAFSSDTANGSNISSVTHTASGGRYMTAGLMTGYRGFAGGYPTNPAGMTTLNSSEEHKAVYKANSGSGTYTSRSNGGSSVYYSGVLAATFEITLAS